MALEDVRAHDRGTDYGNEMEGDWFLSSDWPVDTPIPDDAPFALGLRVFAYPDTSPGAVDARLTDVVAITWDETLGDSGGVVSAVGAVPTDAVALGLDGGDIGGLPFDAVQMSLVSCAASPLTGGDGSLATAPTGDDASVFALADIFPEGGEPYTSVGFVGYLGEVPVWDDLPADAPSDDWRLYSVPNPLSLTTPLRLSVRDTWNHGFGSIESELLATCGAAATPGPAWPPGWPSTPTGKGTAPSSAPETVSVSATGFRDGAELVIRFTTTNIGPPASDVWLVAPGVIVAKDHRILGWAHDWGISYASPPLGNGQSVSLDISLGASSCANMATDPWPAGEYEVYVQQNVDIPAQAGYAEPWSYDVFGGPFTFTLD
jgi:hypothetical protein